MVVVVVAAAVVVLVWCCRVGLLLQCCFIMRVLYNMRVVSMRVCIIRILVHSFYRCSAVSLVFIVVSCC